MAAKPFLFILLLLITFCHGMIPGPANERMRTRPAPIFKVEIPEELEHLSPEVIRSFTEVLQDAANITPAARSLIRLLLVDRAESVFALIDAGARKWGSHLFSIAVKAAVFNRKDAILEKLLARYDYNLSLEALQMATSSDNKQSIKILASQGYNRFDAPMEKVVVEVIKGCGKHGQYGVLKRFLASFPRLTMQIIECFEEAVFRKLKNMRRAFLYSGILGAWKPWHLFNEEVVTARRKDRARLRQLIAEGDVIRIKMLIKNIELPFLVNECALAAGLINYTEKRDIFLMLIRYISPNIIEAEVKTIFKAACIRGRAEAAWPLLKQDHPEIPYLYLALKNSPVSSNRNDIVHNFYSQGYEPCEDEIMDIIRFHFNDDLIPAQILAAYPQKIKKEDLLVLIVGGLTCKKPTKIISILSLFKGADMFTNTRRLAFEILFEKAGLHRRKRILSRKDLIKAILEAVDPRYFGQVYSMDMQDYIDTVNTPEGQSRIRQIQTLFGQRIAACELALKEIESAAAAGEDVPVPSVSSFVRNGGSLEELLLLGAKLDSEQIVKFAVAIGADVFACDYETKLGVLDIIPPSSPALPIVVKQQAEELGQEDGLVWFMAAARSDSPEDVSSIPFGMHDPSVHVLRAAIDVEVDQRRKKLLKLVV